MPFFHNGTYHLYYLLDEGHGVSRQGLGNHQWAHASTTDLVNWTHHPLAIPITEDWEGSICTGSMFWHEGIFYGFYATRMVDFSQHVGVAVSRDGVTFTKTNLRISPPMGYHPHHFRDPHVFRDETTGLFHMLVTSQLVNHPVPFRAGCLAHLVSDDLKTWRFEDPFLVPGYGGVSEPECAEYFYWNGWYYLVFGICGVARYRMSKNPFGPWICPPVDAFEAPMLWVMKSAPFPGNRRIGAAFLAGRDGNRDAGHMLWAGNVVFRELIQQSDGTLGIKFVPEMISGGSPQPVTFLPLTANVSRDGKKITFNSSSTFDVGVLDVVPVDTRITLRVSPQPEARCFGLRLRGAGRYESGYDLVFRPAEGTVELRDQSISCVSGLDKPFDLQIVMKEDIIDVCVDHRRCLINRLPELKGTRLFFFAHNSRVAFEEITIF